MEKGNIDDMRMSKLIEHIRQLEKENIDLTNTFNETSQFLVNYGELSRSVLHANEIIDNAGGWNMLKPENIEEICAAICHAAMRIEVGKRK